MAVSSLCGGMIVATHIYGNIADAAQD